MTGPSGKGGKYSKVISELERQLKALEEQTNRMLAEKDAEIEQLRLRRPEQIKHMVDRFLGWRLPENFNPDCGISFRKTHSENGRWGPQRYEPIGTNLFDATQAEAMVRHMIDGALEH